MKIVLVTNIPNPYRLPLFNEMSRQLTLRGDEFTVLFAAEKYDRRKFILDRNEFQFNYAFLSSSVTTMGNEERAYFSYGDLTKALKQEQPDVIIASGFSMATMKSWWYGVKNNCRLIIWSGSVTIKGKGFSWLRNLQRRFLIHRATAFVAYGSRAKKYLLLNGARESAVFIAINTVDTAFFKRETQKLKELNKEKDNLKHLTFVGYLSNRKKVEELLNCFRILSEKRTDVVLDIIGDGSAKDSLMQKAKDDRIVQQVIFHGFKQKAELPEFLAKSDCFVFQTGFDIWGLVLNEAMAAGLTCVVSPNAGAADDLVIDGETGFVCNFADTEKTVRQLEEVLNHSERSIAIGKKAAEWIAEHATIKVSAEGFIKAIDFAKGDVAG